MYDLILILFFVFSMFVLCVVILTFVKKCTVKEAVKKCKKFIDEFFHELFGTDKFQQTFPLLIGFDEFRRPNYSQLENIFKLVSKNFNICFFIQTNISEERGLVIYKFQILRNENSVDDISLHQIIQAQSEKIVADALNYNGLSTTSVCSLVHVELRENILGIVFALNNIGIAELEKRKRTLRLRKIQEFRSSNSAEFSEKWNVYE